MIGEERIAEQMIANNREISRYSGLADILAELERIFSGGKDEQSSERVD